MCSCLSKDEDAAPPPRKAVRNAQRKVVYIDGKPMYVIKPDEK